MKVSKLTRLAVLLALGVIINYFEAVLLPTAWLVPGVKLGLANTIGIIVLFLYGRRDYISLGLLRVVMTSLFTGFGFNFLIGLAGWAVATLVMIIATYTEQLSIYGLSLVAALGHATGQVLMVTVLYQSPFMINYLPLLAVTSLIAGIVVAYLSAMIIHRITWLQPQQYGY
jgi:heptaprenyl diphosphate synthase